MNKVILELFIDEKRTVLLTGMCDREGLESRVVWTGKYLGDDPVNHHESGNPENCLLRDAIEGLEIRANNSYKKNYKISYEVWDE